LTFRSAWKFVLDPNTPGLKAGPTYVSVRPTWIPGLRTSLCIRMEAGPTYVFVRPAWRPGLTYGDPRPARRPGLQPGRVPDTSGRRRGDTFRDDRHDPRTPGPDTGPRTSWCVRHGGRAYGRRSPSGL
jgi:hypothetical protein